LSNPAHCISVIIPVYREQAFINKTINNIHDLGSANARQIIVVDGQPEGETLAVILDSDVQKIRSPRGRGNQLNRGAVIATGDVLIFLHADTLLPTLAFELIVEAMRDEACVGGAFNLRIDSPKIGFRIIEKVANLRSRLTRIPYGDQAIFLRADYFRTLGGFKDIPIMEEVDFMRRIKRKGGRIVILQEPVLTSARRWEKDGLILGTLRNWLLIILYLCGVEPEHLAQFYR
jgi:rSAM/selenodomain-associated transferase 2